LGDQHRIFPKDGGKGMIVAISRENQETEHADDVPETRWQAGRLPHFQRRKFM
jgi:hypothetical protein